MAALVRRHGPMVLGVCRRVLGNHHDAEDAFQATFLVLARKAGSIVPRELVGNWLYGVAHRTALKARTRIGKQRVRERPVAEMPEPEAAAPGECWRDLRPLLDQELSRLPNKYRIPIVLCDLEGKAGKEAARQLGWPEGTVASRLSRGRAILAKRLTRQGLTIAGGSLAAALSQNGASAGVPAVLASASAKNASLLAAGQTVAAGQISANVAALTQGVLKAMFLNKLKITLVLFAVIGVVGLGLGGVSFRAAANDQPTVASAPQQVARAQGKRSQTVAAQPAKADAQKPTKRDTGKKKPADQDQVRQILEMVLKGMQAYRDSKGGDKDKKTQPPDKAASNLYAEAFLKAFSIASEIAKAKRKARARTGPEDDAVFDAYGPAFVQAYERAKTLKKVLEERKASGGEQGTKALEALNLFLKAGKNFEQAVKRRAKAQAVEHAKREIEGALKKVKKTTQDQRAELETLEEIERVVTDMKEKVRRRKDQR
jgi:RNA polymerase sigma factor (sigma-70 family)